MKLESNGLDLPIEPIKFAGPALEAWNSRKEDNNNGKALTDEFVANYERIKMDLIASINKTIRDL